jgi:hypothetical protein
MIHDFRVWSLRIGVLIVGCGLGQLYTCVWRLGRFGNTELLIFDFLPSFRMYPYPSLVSRRTVFLSFFLLF